MSAEVTSTHPVVQAIVSGTAPKGARMAAAKGLLPLAQNDLLEALVALRASAEAEIAAAADETLAAQEPDALLSVATAQEAAPTVLHYLATRKDLERAIYEAAILNPRTPDEAITQLAQMTNDSAVLESIAINQQRLIRAPAIIEAVLTNAALTGEIERRVRETKREFFEKERGAKQVADELRARGETAAAEFVEAAESLESGSDSNLTLEDARLIAEHIEVSDADIDDSWLMLERLEEFFVETEEERAAAIERLLSESGDASPERIALIRRIMLMTVKDRVKLGMKGDREARSILIRDPNKVVSSAVVHNPRITDQEVEAISAMRTVSDEVLRLISLNRAWARSYPVIHNLARNPRTPIATAMGLLPRIRTKDLAVLAENRNISDSVRRQAQRLARVRAGN
jgi:hypothetical protein